MNNVIKLKIRHGAGTSKNFPWDLVYLFDTADKDLVKDIFECFIVIKAEKYKDALGNITFRHLDKQGFTRDEIISESVDKQKISSMVNLDDKLLVVPLLTRGRKYHKKKLTYMSSQMYRIHGINSGSNVIDASGIELHLDKEKKGTPCVSCPNGMQKMLDPNHCKFGSAECMSTFFIGKGSKFVEKLEGANGSF